MVVFVCSNSGTSKKGNEYQTVTLLEFRKRQEGNDEKIVARSVDFFVKKIDCSGFVPGDVVQAIFEDSELLGGKPELIGIEFKGLNIFKQHV